ncbi:hypothetical protein GALL_531940 [mine drainage metagenome]|uniref:Uncharacterized protein n=1 Tax=mine drainage metagenome TaxID=410659 RepID=A0A1J5P137_9ZZZZ
MTIDPDDMFRADAPGHLRDDGPDIDNDFPVEHRVRVTRKPTPGLDRPLPHLAPRRVTPATDIFVGFFIRRDHAHLGAEFDRKITDGEPPFDRHVADGAAGIFDGVAGAAGGSDVADQREDEILGRHAQGRPALELHAHGFGTSLDKRLRRQHVRQLARPDPESERTQPAMGAGMAVAADDQATGKAETKFRSDDVDDALPRLVDIEHGDTAG